ncbi:MAG: hypothetical protein Tsb009_09460 [Planctomycetaceae bacterium]
MSRHIIACDDASCIVRSIDLKLSKAGFHVQTAEHGQAALELIQKQVPDLLISDCQMPYMNGIELVRNLRMNPATVDLPVILLTAKGYELDHQMLKNELNIKEIISKPFSPRELLKLVNRMLEEQGEQSCRSI